MAELLPDAGPLVLSQAPTPGISPSQVAQPYQELANTLDKAGDTLNTISIRAAKVAAYQALADQKITRGTDGSITVENPDSAPLLFGDAADEYERTVAAGTTANWGNAISQKLTELHAQHPADAAGFKTASDAFLNGIDTKMPESLHVAILREGAQQQTEHLNSITNQSASIDVANNKQAVLDYNDSLKNTAIAIARQNGTSSPQFQQAVSKLDAAYDALGSNPLFRTSPQQIDLEKRYLHGMLQGEAVVSSTDETFNKKGKAAAQQVLEQSILQNPDLKESDRSRLYSQGMSRLQFLSGDAKAAVDANRAVVESLEKGLSERTVSPTDPTVGMAIERATKIGDTEGAQRISAAASVAQHLTGVSVLPDNQRMHILGVGGYDPVNQEIPPEGQTLLKTIGAGESGNRYNVRYGPNGGIAFNGYGDHPRTAEPITSGPDAGKTSTAAGYYQFLAPTWDAEKQKLGLTDFSPANQDAAAWDLAQTTYKDKTGKDLLTTLKSGDTADVLPSLSSQWSSLPGGRQPAQRYVEAGAHGGPGFTADDVQKNPFLMSAYVRTLARDPELRIQSARQTADAISKTIDNGFIPAPSVVAQVNQAAALYPEKLGSVADDMNGKIDAQVVNALPADKRQAVADAYRAATAGPDVHQINIANAFMSQIAAGKKNLSEHPLAEGANRGWIDQPTPLDPTQPNAIAPLLAQRAEQSAKVGSMNAMPAPPLLDKDEAPKFTAALQSPDGPQVLNAIAQTLKPDAMNAFTQQEEVRTAITGMSRSGDPAKMNAAFGFMDTLQKQNPLQFDQQFPNGLKELRAWQSNISFYPQEVVAKRMMQALDPAQAAARKVSDEAADTVLKSISPDKVVSKFSGGVFGTTARAPVAEQAGIAAGALKADYDQNYKDGFALTGDATSADSYAVEKLKNKYAVSPTNGNRVTPYAPEGYYPTINGSHDWMAKQLDDAVAKQLGVNNTLDLAGAFAGAVEPTAALMDERSPAERQYTAQRALVSDDATERDIANKRPPSYQVILRDPNGRWSVMSGTSGTPQRFRFDPAPEQRARDASAETSRAAILSLQSQMKPLTDLGIGL